MNRPVATHGFIMILQADTGSEVTMLSARYIYSFSGSSGQARHAATKTDGCCADDQNYSIYSF